MSQSSNTHRNATNTILPSALADRRDSLIDRFNRIRDVRDLLSARLNINHDLLESIRYDASADTYIRNQRDLLSDRLNRIRESRDFWSDELNRIRESLESLGYVQNDNGARVHTGNPREYATTAEYESLLQQFTDIDRGSSRGTPPALKAAVENLENMVIGEKDGKQALDCAICLEPVKVGEVAKMMPCGHGFHGDCITTWLLSRNSCPLCRSNLPTDDAQSGQV